MAAAPVESQADFPVIFVGDCGVPLPTLQKQLGKALPVAFIPARNSIDAFKEIMMKGYGVICIRMEEKRELAEFAKTFQVAIRQMNLSQIKIMIFSSQEDIQGSRALIQFPFIKTNPPIFDVRRMTTIVRNECTAIHGKMFSPKPKDSLGGLPGGIVIIKGDGTQIPLDDSGTLQEAVPRKSFFSSRPKATAEEPVSAAQPSPASNNQPVPPPALAKAPQPPSAPAAAKNPSAPAPAPSTQEAASILASCVGPDIPTFIYNSDLSWRVRGYFEAFDEANSSVVFHASHDSAADKLKDALKNATSSFLSSSSTPKARIMTSLVFVNQTGMNFTFKAPKTVQGIQRRQNQRAKISNDFPVVVQYVDEKSNTDVTLSVIDVSVGGIGLRIDKDLIAEYKVGQILTNVSLIFFNRTILIPQAEVRHSSRSDINPEFKILGINTKGIAHADLSFIEMFIVAQSIGEPS